MSISALELALPKAQDVVIDAASLTVALSDGRSISAPISWFPRLSHATDAERNAWRLIGDGEGVHWPALDEDVSVEGLLAGRPSAESAASFAAWLKVRKP